VTSTNQDQEPVVIFTDHANLQYYRHPQKINCRVARYINFLEDFHYQLKHIPGTKNHADALFRCPNYNDGSGDNDHVVALSEQVFIQVLSTLALDEQLHYKQKAHQLQLEVWRVKHKLTVKNDQVWYRGQALVVVGEEEDKRALLKLYHDSSTAEHPGQSKMLGAL